ncbi:SSI family serine proteinase inhibitor [Catenuloplanes sp. NPDC051500]|uniref:SSI family serine proteinase inhibitor n=1 Tax=Catenuloplanes sp. NPDC051500 TaxID=3363959 RepID=UPI0037A5EF62
MIRHLAAAALAATALVLPVAAQAAPPAYVAAPVPLAAAPAPASYASLTLTVRAEGVAGRVAPVTLTCGPAGGTHPSPAAACAALAKTNGSAFRLPPRQGVLCTADYRPVIATVTGRWGKRTIADKRTFGNACTLSVAAGVVFASR